MHGCPLRLGLYLKVECMNQSETNFSRTEPHSPNDFGKVSFATSGPPNFINTGDIHKNKDSHKS